MSDRHPFMRWPLADLLKQRKALDASIIKWEDVALGLKLERGTDDCGCCIAFKGWDQECLGCPIFDFTGRSDCWQTPYIDWARVAESFIDNTTAPNGLYAGSSCAVDAAVKELEFLKVVRAWTNKRIARARKNKEGKA